MGDPGYDFRNAVGRADETDELAGYQHIPQQCFFVEQSYGIPLLPVTESDFSIANLPAVFIGHSFEYNSWSKVYKDVRGTYTTTVTNGMIKVISFRHAISNITRTGLSIPRRRATRSMSG